VTAARGLGELATALSRAGARRQLGSEKAVDRALAKSLSPDEAARCAADPRMREDLIAFARTHLDAPPGLAGVRNDLAQVRAAKGAPVRSPEVSVPTLVMQGDADPVVSVDEARYLAESIPGAELELYVGAGHAFFFTRRSEVNARIRSFLGARRP
jgi:pimeloyl-ACP methyl ester carboxylesterase